MVSHFDETSVSLSDDVEDYAVKISEGKSKTLRQNIGNDDLLITADTVVYQNGKIFHKPKTEEDAVNMLRCLASKPHLVITGITVSQNNRSFSSFETTELILHEVEDKHLKNYVRAFQSLNKCGGYSIQNGGGLIIKDIKGCSYNVQGLPINTLRRLLIQFGIDLWDFIL